MIADFIPIKDQFNQVLLKPPEIEYDRVDKDKFGIKVELENCIKNFASPEILNGNNQRFCEKCSKMTDSTKYLKLIKEPDILMCHVIRP